MWKKLLLSTAMLAAMCGPAAAQATLTITGDVDAYCTVIGSGNQNLTPGPLTLDSLTISGAGRLFVANFSYRCNAPGGFQRVIHSANNGRLVNGIHQGPLYYLEEDNHATGLGFSARTLQTDHNVTIAPNSAFQTTNGVGSDIYLTITGPNLLTNGGYVAGNYADTVTVTITPQP